MRKDRRPARFRGSVAGCLLLVMCLLFSPTVAVDAQDGFAHPRKEATEHIFQRLVNALQDEYPIVQTATLHFVTLDVANAWVNQNAEVYVTSGLLDLLKTDHQIAGVLAHELAHVTQQHVPQQIRRNLEWSLLVLALALAADRSGPYDDRVLSVLHPLVMYGYSREAELEADEVGMTHAIRAGYDPMGLVEALELITAESAVLPQHWLWLTHPLPEQRLIALRQRIDPRMGIPQARVVWGRTPRTHYDNPVDAATAFIQATYTEPDTLASRLPSDSTALAAGLETWQGLYPRWPDSFAVRPLGVVIESETRTLLNYTVTGHLELATALGTARGPSLAVQIEPAAGGWQVKDVTLVGLPAPQDDRSPVSAGPSLDPASLPADPAAQTYLQALLSALQLGNAALLPPALHDVQTDSPDAGYRHVVGAVKHLLDHGFQVTLLSFQTRELTPEERSLWSDTSGAFSPSAYLEVDLAWRLTAPEGQSVISRQRLWAAIAADGDAWRTADTRLVSL